MTKETFHAKILEEEKKNEQTEKSLSVVADVLKQFPTTSDGLASYNQERVVLHLKNWVLDLLKEADSMYEKPKPKAEKTSDDAI